MQVILFIGEKKVCIKMLALVQEKLIIQCGLLCVAEKENYHRLGFWQILRDSPIVPNWKIVNSI